MVLHVVVLSHWYIIFHLKKLSQYIHSICGHFGFFLVFTFTNSAVTCILTHVFGEYVSTCLLGIYLGIEFLDVFMFCFSKYCQFSKAVVPIHTPSCGNFTSYQQLCFHYSYSGVYIVVSHCGFNLHSLMVNKAG